MNLILLGAPGAGKGTQAEVICEKYQIPAISTGNIIRAAIKAGTELGKQVKDCIEKGDLVPDNIVIELVKNRVADEDCKNGFILDGFPRTIPQAEALDKMNIKIDKVIEIAVADEVIVQRLSGRRVCSNCGTSYHLQFNPTQKEGVCDLCGSKTELRKDDSPKTVRERLMVYHNQTEPLREYYKKQNKLFSVLGQDSIEETSAMILKVLEA